MSDELEELKRRHARAIEIMMGNAHQVEKLEAELASAWDKGFAAHALGITDAAGDPNPYRRP